MYLCHVHLVRLVEIAVSVDFPLLSNLPSNLSTVLKQLTLTQISDQFAPDTLKSILVFNFKRMCGNWFSNK